MMLTIETPMKHMTADGLIMKGIDRIEAINTPSEERTQANFRSWQMSRVVRRDFNLLTAKMFVLCLNPSNLQKIRPMLLDVQEEAEALNNMALRYEMPKDLPVTTLPLRIVSDQARRLYEAIAIVDWALAKLLKSEMSEVAVDNCAPFFKAYGRLKNFIFYRPKYAVGQKTIN